MQSWQQWTSLMSWYVAYVTKILNLHLTSAISSLETTVILTPLTRFWQHLNFLKSSLKAEAEEDDWARSLSRKISEISLRLLEIIEPKPIVNHKEILDGVLWDFFFVLKRRTPRLYITYCKYGTWKSYFFAGPPLD